MSSQAAGTGASQRALITETWMPRAEYAHTLLSSGVGQRVSYAAGDYLFEQGEVDHRFFILVSGKVHVSNLSPDGQESTFNIMGAGSVIGEAAALTGLPRYSAARAVESCELLMLEASQMEDYIRQSPHFALALIQVLSLKQRLAVGRLHRAVFLTPDQRILHLLEQLSQAHADRGMLQDEQRLLVHLTHEQIGGLTDLSRVTVTRALQRLKQEGTIDLEGRHIVLRPQPHKR